MDYIRTEIIEVNAKYPEQTVIERAAKLLHDGELVVFPTETVYGLGADAFQPAALERIFAAKGRPFSDPLIVHIADEHELELLTTTIPTVAKRLAHEFWPGPLTLILPRGPRVPLLVTAGLETVAIRMPRHPVALALISALGIGVESTVLDLCSDEPRILRPGGISLEALRTILPDLQPPIQRIRVDEVEEILAKKAPGQLLTHYAPGVPLLLFDGTIEEMHTSMLAEIERRYARGEHVGILVAEEDIPTFQDSNALVYAPGSEDNLVQVAANLFAGLRSLEEAHVQVILCRNFGEQGLGLAIRDRLLKAAGGKFRK